MADKIQISSSKSEQISALYTHPKPIAEQVISDEEDQLIVMVHGFPGHKSGNNDLYGDLEFLLAEKELHVLRFDFRGCGESDGKEEEFSFFNARDDLRLVMKWARKRGYKRFIFIAEGIGATVAIMTLGMEVDALVLLWPVLDAQAYFRDNFAGVEVDDETRKNAYVELDGHKYGMDFARELKRTQMAMDLREIKTPTLILHGVKDEAVPVSHIDMARQYINAKRLEITTFHDGGQGLQKLNHRKMMFHHIMQFLGKYT